jgi:hypothetical protein
MSATNNAVTADQLDELGQPVNNPNAPLSQDDPMIWDNLENTLPGNENETLPAMDAPQDDRYAPSMSIPATGVQFDIRRLDGLQTQEEFEALTPAQKELFYLRHVEKVEMTPKAGADYVLRRNEQKQAQQDPFYQQRLRKETANADKAVREGRGEEYFASGWERYKDEKTGRMGMRIIPGGPADREIRNQSRLISNRATFLLDNLDQAEAMVDSFGATGFVGQLTQGIDASPAGVLRSKIDPAVGANVVDQLIEMKKAGATLGQVTAPELEMLKRMNGVLSVGLPADVLKPNIQAVRAMWKDVLSKLDEDTMKALDSMGGTPAAQPTGTGQTKKMLGKTVEKYSDGSWRPPQTK